MEDIDSFFFFFLKQANSLGGFGLQVPNGHLRIVVLTLLLFSKPLPYSSDLFCMYTFQGLVWDLGSDLNLFLSL